MECKVIEFPNMRVNVIIPNLTKEERRKRLDAIKKAASNLMQK